MFFFRSVMDGNGTNGNTLPLKNREANIANGANIVNSDFCQLLRSTAWATPAVYYLAHFLMHPVQCDQLPCICSIWGDLCEITLEKSYCIALPTSKHQAVATSRH